jgi:hypothetical protein
LDFRLTILDWETLTDTGIAVLDLEQQKVEMVWHYVLKSQLVIF